MKRPTIITISGKPGSGKSSTATTVAKTLNYTHYSSGDWVRSTLEKRGLSLTDFNKIASHNREIDEEIDQSLRDLREAKDVVIDARLGFYWIPESFKVYLDLDLDTATARIIKDALSNPNRESEITHDTSIANAKKQVLARMNNEHRRFQKIYGVNPYDTNHFDLVINTSLQSPETVAQFVVDNYHEWQQSDAWSQVYLQPRENAE